MVQRERCWKQLRTPSGASPIARYWFRYRQCHPLRFSSMPRAKSSVSVQVGVHPASWYALARTMKLVPVQLMKSRASYPARRFAAISGSGAIRITPM